MIGRAGAVERGSPIFAEDAVEDVGGDGGGEDVADDAEVGVGTALGGDDEGAADDEAAADEAEGDAVGGGF